MTEPKAWKKTYSSVKDIIAEMKPSRPVLCFNPTKIHDNVANFKKGFKGVVGWAVKSNPDPVIIQAIVEGGVRNFDVASADEIDRIRKYCPDAILHFNHPVKPIEEIKYAYFKAGIRNFILDDIAEMEKIIAVLKKGKVTDFSGTTLLIRYRNPDKIDKGHYDFGKKFGATPDNAIMLLRKAHDYGFKVGIGFHPGSQNEKLSILTSMIERGFDIADKALKGTDGKIIRFNVGGGFPCHYPNHDIPELDEYFDTINTAMKDYDGEVFCEPGRALVANSISVITRVNLRKTNDNRLYLNDGFYGSFMELPFVNFLPPRQAYSSKGEYLKSAKNPKFEIWGPTCDSLDRLPKPISLPDTIQTSDYIEFGLMGSYTNATATKFNGIPVARMVIVTNLRDWNELPD